MERQPQDRRNIEDVLIEQSSTLFESGICDRLPESYRKMGDTAPLVIASPDGQSTWLYLGLRYATDRIKIVPVGSIGEEGVTRVQAGFEENDVLLLSRMSEELEAFCEVTGVSYNLEQGRLVA